MKVGRKVSERGQVTLPKELRERLGIVAETEVYFDEEDGKIILEKEEDRESFSTWSEEVSSIVGKLERSTGDYRDGQYRDRLK